MKLRMIRPLISGVLLATFALSLFPLSFDITAPVRASTPSPRPGKNGGPAPNFDRSTNLEGSQQSSSTAQDPSPPPRRKAPPFDRPPIASSTGRDSGSASSGNRPRSSSGDGGSASSRSGQTSGSDSETDDP